MGIILLLLKLRNERKLATEYESLVEQNDSYKKSLTPELKDAVNLDMHIKSLHKEEQQIETNIDSLKQTAFNLENQIKEKQNDMIVLDEEIAIQEFGLYKPQYDFASALDYKEKLAELRDHQKDLIKSKRAVTGVINWKVDGNAAKGRKMVADTQKLLLRAFNNECDTAISKVRYTNFDASLHRIRKSAEVISKLGSIMNISIRLNPQDRVDELGDASVPFKFDVHAMIFSEDAPALEAALHRAFEDKKLNMVNQRREFFNVTLDEIKEVVRKNYDKTVEFIDIPDAEQYRVSKKMRENKDNAAVL